MTEDAPNTDSVIRMDAYDALPPSLRKAISESLPDPWDTWTALELFQKGLATEKQLVGMVRNSEVQCHLKAVRDGIAAEVKSKDFILKSRKRKR